MSIDHACYVVGDGIRFVQHETMDLLSENDLDGTVACIGSHAEALHVYGLTVDAHPDLHVRIWMTDAETPLELLERVLLTPLLRSA